MAVNGAIAQEVATDCVDTPACQAVKRPYRAVASTAA